MTNAILEITDGTTRVDLINPSSGFHLIGWTPQITDYKGGGVFQNPPLADWRQLRAAKWDTAQERFELTLNGANPNGIAYLLQQLRQLLEKANQYWTTDWQNDPVWLVAKAACETETRYCLIVKGRLANDQNHYLQPFTGNKSTMENLPLLIERRAWLGNRPGSETSVLISALETYDGVNFGNVDSSGVREPVTAADAVFVANKRNVANLTNIHLGTGGANRIGAVPPYDIIAATGSTYFGIDTSVSNSGTFSSLVFDIGTTGVGGPTIVWEYWNGAAWSTLTTSDQTGDFAISGINAITWNLPSDWATNSPGGGLPTGYWVRARITAGSFSTEPVQQNRNVYSVVWPYIEIQSSEVGGDISALSRILAYVQSYEASGVENFVNRIVIGLRSMTRGEDFTAYLNCANEQNPSGVTVAVVTDTTFVSDAVALANSSVGQSALFNPVNTNDAVRVRFTIGDYIRDNAYGKFRFFARVSLGGAATANAMEVYYQLSANGLVINGPVVSVDGNTDVLDFGDIDIPGYALESGADTSSMELRLLASSTDISTDLYFHDIIWIPVDEWALDTFDQANGSTTKMDDTNLLDVNSTRIPKVVLVSHLRDLNFRVRFNWQKINNGPSILQANTKQRLWFFTTKYTTAGGTTIESPVENLMTISVKKNQRYLSLRGEQ